MISYLVDRVLSQADERFGEGLRNLPMQELELALKQSVATYLSSGSDEDKGLVGYVVRRARNALVPRIETYLLSAYREELKVDGSGGGVSLEKVREPALKAISKHLAEIVMSPLNKQLAIFMTLYLLLAVGWWFWLLLLLAALSRVSGH